MERLPVKSTNIAAVGYDSELKVLEVEFVNSGAVYQYYGVPAEVYQDLMDASSPGRYFSQNIINTYTHARMP